MESIVTVLYNCARFEECKRFLQYNKGVENISKFTKIRDSDLKLLAVLFIAYIADENQSELFQQDASGVRFLISTFTKTVKTPMKRYAGWSAEELAAGK